MEWFYSLFSPHSIQNMLNIFGYPAVTLFILVESIGVPLPGEAMILFASFYAATTGQLLLPVVITCAACGAIIGDNLGYYVGRTGGRAFVKRFGRYIFLKPEHLDQAEAFFAKHGAKTVFFGRFITLLRMWAAVLAGLNRMPWRTFMFYNATGGIVWSLYVGLLGYFAGLIFHDHFDQVQRLSSTLGWLGAAFFLLTTGATLFFLRWRRRSQATHVVEAEEVEEQAEVPVLLEH